MTPPRRQMRGKSQRGSALSFAPMLMRKRVPSCEKSARLRRGPDCGWRSGVAGGDRDGVNPLADGKAAELAREQAAGQLPRRNSVLDRGEQRAGRVALLGRRRGDNLVDEARLGGGGDRPRVGRRRPGRLDVRRVQQPLGLAALGDRGDQHRRTLAAGAAGAAAAVDERVGVQGQIGVHDQIDVGQVQAARGHVGRDQHLRVAAPQLLEGAIALGLRAFAGDGGGREAAGGQRFVHLGDTLARRAEDDGARAGVARAAR